MKRSAVLVAALVLAPLSMVRATADVPGPSPRLATDVVGLWDPGFGAAMSAEDCGRWRLDANGFCTADDTRNGVELGMKFQASRSVTVTGIRSYLVDLGAVTGTLWDAHGTRLASGRFAPADAPGWQDLTFATPVTIAPGRTYIASYYSPATRYAFHYRYFTDRELVRGPITALRAVEGDPNGVHCYDVWRCRFPVNGYRDSSYWVTPLWESPAGDPPEAPAVPSTPADVEPPYVRAATPTRRATRVAMGATIRVTFTEHLRAALLTRANVRLVRKGHRTPVPARRRYYAGRHRLVLNPVGRLRPDTTYRVVVTTRVVDLAGNRLDQDPRRSGAQRATWTFRTR